MGTAKLLHSLTQGIRPVRMGGSSSSLVQSHGKDEVLRLQKETGFTLGQMERLHARFTKLCKKTTTHLTREDLLALPDLCLNPLGDRIIHAFFALSKEGNCDGEENELSFKEFACVMATFRSVPKTDPDDSPGSKRQKLKFAFRMYDLDGDGEISKDELVAVLSMMCDGMDDKELNKIAEKFVQEIDHSEDDLISLDEFIRVMDSCGAEDKMSMRF